MCRAATRSSTCSSSAAARSSRTPRPAGAQAARGRGAPVLEQQLDVPDQLERGAGGGPVDEGGVPCGGGERRRHVDRLAGGAAAPQRDHDLPGDRHVPAVAGDEQPPGEELVDRAGLVPAADRPVGALDAAVLALRSRCSRIARALSSTSPISTSTCAGSARWAAIAVTSRCRSPLGRDPEVAGEGRDPARAVAGEQRLGRGAEPADRRTDHVRDHAQRPQRLVGAPDQRHPAQPLHGRVDGLRGGVDPVPEQGDRRTAPGRDHRVQDGQLEGGELVRGPQHRRPGAGPGRQLGRVLGRRGGQVGTVPEQAQQRVVGPAAELLGEGAGCRRLIVGHPHHVTARAALAVP